MATVCFDVYGTLFDPTSVRFRLKERLSVSRRVADDVVAQWRERQLTYALLLAVMGTYRPYDTVTSDALKYALDAHDLDPRALDIDAALGGFEALDPFDDVEPVIARLTEADHRLALVSNGTPGMLEAVVENTALEGVFDPIVSADDVSTYKPAPAVYERATDRLEVEPGACWYVTANGWDAAGAATAGLRTVWVNRSGEPPERVGTEPEVTRDSLTAIADVLE